MVAPVVVSVPRTVMIGEETLGVWSWRRSETLTRGGKERPCSDVVGNGLDGNGVARQWCWPDEGGARTWGYAVATD